MMKLFVFLLLLLTKFPIITTDTVWENNDGIRLIRARNATLVNDQITGFQNMPKVTKKGNSNFTILWTSNTLKPYLRSKLI